MTEVPKHLYYPVEYNPSVDNRQSIYEQKRREQEKRRHKRQDWYRLQLQEEQYEQDAMMIDGRGRK